MQDKKRQPESQVSKCKSLSSCPHELLQNSRHCFCVIAPSGFCWRLLHLIILCVLTACVQAGTGRIHEGADSLDSNWLLWQSALHQPHRGQDGRPGPVGWGVQGTQNVLLNLLILYISYNNSLNKTHYTWVSPKWISFYPQEGNQHACRI